MCWYGRHQPARSSSDTHSHRVASLSPRIPCKEQHTSTSFARVARATTANTTVRTHYRRTIGASARLAATSSATSTASTATASRLAQELLGRNGSLGSTISRQKLLRGHHGGRSLAVALPLFSGRVVMQLVTAGLSATKHWTRPSPSSGRLRASVCNRQWTTCDYRVHESFLLNLGIELPGLLHKPQSSQRSCLPGKLRTGGSGGTRW